MIEITALTKEGGPLTKRIGLAEGGTLRSDGSACVMSAGTARRAQFRNLSEFADHISDMRSDEAVALGALRPDLPETVSVVTKNRLALLNGAAAPNTIARTTEYIQYLEGVPALALIDVDIKGMPPEVATRIKAAS